MPLFLLPTLNKLEAPLKKKCTIKNRWSLLFWVKKADAEIASETQTRKQMKVLTPRLLFQTLLMIQLVAVLLLQGKDENKILLEETPIIRLFS